MINLTRGGFRNRHLFALDVALVPVATLPVSLGTNYFVVAQDVHGNRGAF